MADKSARASGRFFDTGFFVLASVLWLLAEAAAGYFINARKWDTTTYYLMAMVFELALFIPAAVYIIVRRISLAALFGRANAPQVISGAFLGVLIVPVSIVLSALGTFLVMLTGGSLPQGGVPSPVTAVQYLAAFAALGLAAPIVEEPMMRGLVLGGQAGVFSRNRAVLFTGLIFALMHGKFAGLASLIMGGVVLTALAWRSGSIWPSIAFHLTYNSSTILVEALRNNILKAYDTVPITYPVTPEILIQFFFSLVVWVFIALPFATASAAVLWGYWRYTPKACRPKPEIAKLPMCRAWPWLVSVFLLIVYNAIDVLQIYGIINLVKK